MPIPPKQLSPVAPVAEVVATMEKVVEMRIAKALQMRNQWQVTKKMSLQPNRELPRYPKNNRMQMLMLQTIRRSGTSIRKLWTQRKTLPMTCSRPLPEKDLNILRKSKDMEQLWNCWNQELGYSLMYHKQEIPPRERTVVSTWTTKLISLLRRDPRTTSSGEQKESPRKATALSKSATMPRLTCQSLQWA